MRADRESRTAEYVAAFRAAESARPASERLFSDPLATSFLSRPLRGCVALASVPGVNRLFTALVDWRWPGPRPSAIARTRLIDDAVCDYLDRGLDQLVILGAGYDTRAYRLPGMRGLRVYEVDHPQTQAVKRRVIEKVFGEVPRHVRLVAADFEDDDLAEVMAKTDLLQGGRTCLIWEGVLAYLTPVAGDKILRWAGSVVGPGSELVFTYIHRGLLDGSQRFPSAGSWVNSVRAASEPFRFGLDPRGLESYLLERGWRLLDDLSTTEALAQLGRPLRNVPSFYRIARARTATN